MPFGSRVLREAGEAIGNVSRCLGVRWSARRQEQALLDKWRGRAPRPDLSGLVSLDDDWQGETIDGSYRVVEGKVEGSG